MTIDEAIKHEEQKAEDNYRLAGAFHTDEGVYLEEETKYRMRAEEHEQLAEWLKELKEWRSAKRVRLSNDNTETLIFDLGE